LGLASQLFERAKAIWALGGGPPYRIARINASQRPEQERPPKHQEREMRFLTFCLWLETLFAGRLLFSAATKA
jgi:hypothetical protein